MLISSDIPSKSTHSIFAVFDGHGGAGAAIYAADSLLKLIEEHPGIFIYFEIYILLLLRLIYTSSEWRTYCQDHESDD